ncbi:protein adenylyltransferase SelO [Sulfurimonas sp.]
MKFSNLQLTTPYLKLDPLFYDKVSPTPLEKPYIISTSQDAAKLLGVDEDLNNDERILELVNGETFLAGSEPFAMAYAGHQFGYFAGRLGDGRAINLGKVNGWNLQLKGSGLTLYSRRGDGRAVLRSSIREYLMSEAMYGLGIETSRALALIGSQSSVAREQWEKGAIVLRLSPTWVRFGTFEYFNSIGEYSKLEELADYVIDESFSYLKEEENRYLKMYAQIVKNTATTLAHWQSVGFNHGVMNTDNMSIDGRTIDYGPFAFLDDYDSNYVCNHTDSEGRYSFKNQPGIAHWNLSMLARALSPLVNYEDMQVVLDDIYANQYEKKYLELMKNKLGLFQEEENDASLVRWLLGTLESCVVDYTLFFRKLSYYNGDNETLTELCEYQQRPLQEWLEAYSTRLKKESLDDEVRKKKMLASNPKYILKNFLLQEAIEKAQNGDFSMVDDMLSVAHAPFDEHLELEYLARQTPKSAKNIKLSCSS